MKGGWACLKGGDGEDKQLKEQRRAAAMAQVEKAGETKVESKDRDEEKDNKVQASVGGQIKNEQKVGGRTVELTKSRKQS